MTPEEYLITTHVGEVARQQLWQADETADLDLPGGWIIEMQDGNIRVFDSATHKGDDTVRELTVPSFQPSEKVSIDLPPSARDRWRRSIKVELNHIRKPSPVYVVSSDIQTLEKPGPKQPFLFYGQDFLLVHHRPVRLNHQITLLGYDIFSFSQESNGDFIVKSKQNGLRVESDTGVKKLAKGDEVRLAGASTRIQLCKRNPPLHSVKPFTAISKFDVRTYLLRIARMNNSTARSTFSNTVQFIRLAFHATNH